MYVRRIAFLTMCMFLALCGWWVSRIVAAQAMPEPKPSSYAPAKDLLAQGQSLLTELETDLANAAEYGEDQQGRVGKNASTLAAITLVLGMHDEENAWKKPATKIIAVAKKLAAAAKTHAEAATALSELKGTLTATEAEAAKWTSTADLALLMKAVPIVNNSLRRGVEGRRFAQSTEKNAALAATLAAMAQASAYDLAYCDSEQQEAEWAAICRDMRNAAGEVHAAVRKGDQEAAKLALENVVKSCDACHHKFRD